MNLEELREEIDAIDDTLVQAFAQRMDVVARVSQAKKEQGLPTLDPAREREKLADIAAKLPPELEQYGYALWSMLFEISRGYQNAMNPQPSALRQEIQAAIEHTPNLFPPSATVACQGVEGAYSQLACEKLFKHPQVMYFGSFESVFSAIENGFCDYGVLPLENSTAGSVNAIYDLMMKHDFRIVRSVRLKVDHNLLVKPGTKRSDITEIYSHQQALSQCEQYLQAFPGVKIIPCENTAVAAQKVAEGDGHAAALSSRSCMKLYGLECLEAGVQDQGSNFTRFICISKKLEIYPGADRTSLMAVLPHEPGSLCRVLSRFYALGLNLNKLESRPMPERNFEFMFYFDLETPVYAPEFLQLMGELPSLCEEFSYLGSYSEVV